MIQTTLRDGGRGFEPFDTRVVDSGRALMSFIEFEVGYGGIVTGFTDGSVTVETRVLGTVDRVTYEGSEEELQPFLEATLLIAQYYDAQREDGWKILSKKVMDFTGGNPRLITMGMGMFQGAGILRILFLYFASAGSEAVLKKLEELPPRDLKPMCSLVLIDKATAEDVLSLLE